MSSDQAAKLLHAAPRSDRYSSAEDGKTWPLSPSASSSSGPTGTGGGRRLTPDTGSDADDDYEDDEDVKDGAEDCELREGIGQKQLYTPEEEQAVVRKFDRRLVVFMAFLYMLSFIDRSNIGNARVAGMDDDLQSVPPRDDWYEWALGAFYITYILFEWMALLWRLIPAHIYVACLVLSWGVIASLQAVAVNYPMLIFLRALLGIGEAGFTGVPFYLSFFFKRHELAFRTAIFVSAAPLATSFASSLAWLILKFAELVPIAPWRLLFLIEGFPSVLVAAFAWHIIPDSPQTAPYLTPREKKVARMRLEQEREKPNRTTSVARDTLTVLADPAAWLTAAIFFLTNMAYSSLPVFMPTILRAMGHDALSAQALSAPPYLVSFLVVLATAYLSDAMRARSPLLIIHALSSATGYTLLALPPTTLALPPSIRYLALYPAAVGFFNVVVLTIAWSLNNQRGAARQGAGFALLQAVGQCGPLVGTRLYPDRDAPYYSRGMAVCAGAMVGVACLAGGLRWWLGRVNRRWDREEGVEGVGRGRERERTRAEGGEEGEALVGGGVERRGEMGRGMGFRYML